MAAVGSEMTLWVKALTNKLDDLSSSCGTYTGEGEN